MRVYLSGGWFILILIVIFVSGFVVGRWSGNASGKPVALAMG